MTTRHVFTYGSLMFDAVWSRVVAGSYRSREANLNDFRRFAIRDETYPAIVPATGFQVSGRLWLDVASDDLERLDRFEGADYRRESVGVRVQAGAGPVADLMADCYVWLDASRLLATEWDPVRFEHEHLPGFALRHGAPPSPG